MADKWRSKYVNTEIEAILDKANKRPFYILYDEEQSLYRFFPSAEDAQTWLDARAEGVISEEVNALQFAEPITAPAPFKLNLTGLVNNKVFLYGSTDCNLEFDFETVEGSGSSTIEEGIDVYYTIESADNTINKTQSYDSGEHVSFNLSEYLSIGPNTITIHAVGRTTKATRTTVVTYRTIELSLISDIADRSKRNNYQTGANIGISYTAESQEQKTVYCYIDGELYKQVKLNAGKINGTFSIAGLGAGKHLVQLYAEVVSGEDYFRTDVITSEIVIYGEIVDGTSVYMSAVMLSASFPYSQGIIDPEVSFPVLNLERFMAFKLNWEYYSQSNIYDTATIKWVLESAGEQEDAPEDAVITMMNASTSGVRPEVISITPVNTGTFLLKAYRYDPYDETYESEPLCEYAMYVSENSHGIKDVTERLELKLSASGRKNSEDASIRDKWTYNNGSREISTTFSDMLWTDRSGWSKDALVLNGGATAEIDIKPLSSQILNINDQGCTIEIEFETFNVDNYDVPVVQIRNSQNGENEPVFKIYADSARIKSGATNGSGLTARFKANERIRLSFIIHPSSSSLDEYSKLIFIQNNGILGPVTTYNNGDIFSLGNGNSDSVGKLVLGDESGQCGVKIYSVRVYSRALSMYEGLSTFIIDGSDNAKRIVEANDIYGQTEGQIDVLKLASKITTVRITGNIQRLITAMDKQEVTAALEVTSPEDPSINFHCDYALLKNAGQSTLGMPVPSMHVKLDKNNNICYDRDNKVLPKNRWAFRKGNVPEKKFRLQSNYMDSSGCHNGSFLRMFNEIVNGVEINGEKVLRIPAQAYAQDKYAERMKELHGADKDTSRNWKFPYNINMVPDSIACIVIWRPNESSAYRFLGQYVIMEEKKANYANGMHSIYDTIDANGNPDPFKFYTKDKNSETLWDNEDCLQVEIVERSDNTMLLDSSLDAIRNTTNFELIYPDPDDIKEEHEKDSSKPTVNDFWQKFFDGFVDPIRLKGYEPATTKEEHDQMVQDAQEEFDAIYASYRTDYAHCPIEKWHFVAYYCLMLRHCCVDSALRNIELTTYDGQHWLPKWWDVDMQCGLRQTGEGDVPPCSDRDSTIDNDSTFVFDGRYFNTEDGNRIYKSFYLWDALENCEEFMEDVREMDDALSKSWQYDSITQLQDDEYVGKWSESLYNESGMVKYVEQSYDSEQGVYSNDYLIMMQGSHVSHRHWFLKKSFDFFDSLHACGEYTHKKIYAKVQGASGSSQFKITASEPAYFCWGQTNTPAVTSVFLQKGQSYTFAIPDNFNIGSSPLDIYAANRLEEVDFMDLAHYLQGTVSFEFCYDAVTGSGLKRVLAGISMTDMLQGEFNNYGLGDSKGNLTMIGLSLLDKLEVLDVRGLLSLNSIEIAGCVSLKEFYAAGSNITTFEPAAGTIFEEVELPTTVSYIHLNGSKLPTSGIDWYKTASDNGAYTLTEADMPRVTRLELQNCGNDAGVRALVEEWCQTIESYILSNPEQAANFLNNIAHISIDDVNWANFSVTHLITLSKIVNKQITGYIMCSTAYTNEQMDMLMANFGDSVFTLGSPLVLDCVGGEDSGKITAAPLTQNDAGKVENYDDRIEIRQGHSAKLRYIGFPLARTQVTYTWYVNNSNSWFGSGHNKHKINGDVITLDEASALDEEYEITCSISGDDVSQNVTQNLVAKSRSYPSSVELKPKDSPNVLYIQSADEYQISNDSVNTFEAQFTPDSYDGTLDEGHWELTPNPNSETESIPEGITHHNGIRNTGGVYSDEDRFFTLDVTGISELQEDISLMLSYYSDWKASNKRVPSSGTANAIINILKNIAGILTSSGNYYLYNIIYAISPHPNTSPSYGSAVLKSITGEIKASEYPDAVSLITSVICGNYNVLQYMPNVSVFDFRDCIKLKGNIDLSLNSRCTKAIFTNTDTGDIELYEGGREVSVIGYAHPSKLELSGFYLTTSQKPVSWAGHVKQTRIPFLSGSDSMKNGFPCGEAVNCANPSARNGIKLAVDNTARAISIDDVAGIDTISLAYQGNSNNRYWCLAFLAAIGGSLRTIRRPHFNNILTDKCYYGICYYEEGEYHEDWEPGGYTTIPESAKDSDGHFICMSRLELRASYSIQSAQDEGVAYRVLSREESASLLSRLNNSEDAEEQELADRLSAQMAFDVIDSAIADLTINNTETHFIGSDGNGSFVSKIAMSNYGGSIIWNPEFDKDNSTDDGSNYACGIVECRPKYNLEEEPYYIGVCRLKDFNKS